jgi:hypothetical protein
MWMWIVALAMIALVVGALAVISVARRSAAAKRGRPMPEADPWYVLGICLTGAGTALFVTIGPAMIGIFVAGLVFIAVGARRMRGSVR